MQFTQDISQILIVDNYLFYGKNSARYQYLEKQNGWYKSKILKNQIMRIYKLIYYDFFLKSIKVNSAPEIPVYAMLSFTQTSNFITIINIIFAITRPNFNYDVLKLVLICPILFYFINYYYFTTKGNGAIIIKDKSYSSGKYSFLLDVYNLGSFFLMAITYWFYSGVLKLQF